MEKTKFKDATFWRKKHDIVVKGERCPITGLWFWSPIAKCGCYDDGAIFEGDNDFDEDHHYDENEDDFEDYFLGDMDDYYEYDS